MKPSEFLLITNICTILALVYFFMSGKLPPGNVWVVAPVSLVGVNLAALLGLRLRKKQTK